MFALQALEIKDIASYQFPYFAQLEGNLTFLLMQKCKEVIETDSVSNKTMFYQHLLTRVHHPVTCKTLF